MGKQILLDKKQETKDNQAIITETVETTMTIADLERTIKDFETKMLRNQKEFYANKEQRDYYKALHEELTPIEKHKLTEELEV